MSKSVILLLLLCIAGGLLACSPTEPDAASVQNTPAINTPETPTEEPVQPTAVATESQLAPTPVPPTAVPTGASEVVTEDATTEMLIPIVEESPTAILATEISLSLVASGYEKPVYLTHAGDERLFVVEQPGIISILRDGEHVEPAFLDIQARVGDRGNEQGLLGLAFHPDYANNGRLFVHYTDVSGDSVVSEFAASGDSADPDSERIILSVSQPYRNHNGGQIAFGLDNYLYIGLGDGGSGGDPDYNGLDRTTLLGAILRIDVDGAEPYAIPADNPFVSDDEARNEIWAWGLRNPWRFSFDQLTNDLYIGDVGQNQWEEISFESAESPGGVNFGWNAWEGSACYTEECETIVGVPPITEYSHSSGDGCSVTGGYVYRGSNHPDLAGNYFYGDFCSSNIWATVEPAEGEWPVNLVFSTSGVLISSFGEDVNGELYVVDLSGNIFSLQP